MPAHAFLRGIAAVHWSKTVVFALPLLRVKDRLSWVGIFKRTVQAPLPVLHSDTVYYTTVHYSTNRIFGLKVKLVTLQL